MTGGFLSVADAKSHGATAAETVAGVAAREHVSANQLTRLNDLDGSVPLRAGTVLGLDGASAAAVSVQTAADSGERAAANSELRDALSNPVAGSDAAMWGESGASGADLGLASAGTAASAKTPAPLHNLANRILRRTSSIAASLTKNAMQFIGTPYVFGGTTPSGFDCSGYTQYVFAHIGIKLPRTADVQYAAGSTIHGDLVVGDLVFFQTYEPGPSHVGIYIGNGHFIHSSSHGVRVSALSESYWASRYLGAKRFMKSAQTASL